ALDRVRTGTYPGWLGAAGSAPPKTPLTGRARATAPDGDLRPWTSRVRLGEPGRPGQHFAEVGDRALQALLERHARLPAEGLARPRDVRPADLRIIRRQGAMLDPAPASRQGEHALGKLPDRELVRVADVRGLRRPAMEETDDPLDQVVHVAEGPGLSAVAVDGERLSAQRLDDEVRHHAAVVRPHAGTVRVE